MRSWSVWRIIYTSDNVPHPHLNIASLHTGPSDGALSHESCCGRTWSFELSGDDGRMDEWSLTVTLFQAHEVLVFFYRFLYISFTVIVVILIKKEKKSLLHGLFFVE